MIANENEVSYFTCCIRSITASMIDVVITNNFLNYVHVIMAIMLIKYLKIDKNVEKIERKYFGRLDSLIIKNVINKNFNLYAVDKKSPFIMQDIIVTLEDGMRITFVQNIKKEELLLKRTFQNNGYVAKVDEVAEIEASNFKVFSDNYGFNIVIELDDFIEKIFTKHNIEKNDLVDFYQKYIEKLHAPIGLEDKTDELFTFKDFTRTYFSSKLNSSNIKNSIRFLIQSDPNAGQIVGTIRDKFDLELNLSIFDKQKKLRERYKIETKYDERFYYDIIYDNIYMFIRYYFGPLLISNFEGIRSMKTYLETFITSYKGFKRIENRVDFDIISEIFDNYVINGKD